MFDWFARCSMEDDIVGVLIDLIPLMKWKNLLVVEVHLYINFSICLSQIQTSYAHGRMRAEWWISTHPQFWLDHGLHPDPRTQPYSAWHRSCDDWSIAMQLAYEVWESSIRDDMGGEEVGLNESSVALWLCWRKSMSSVSAIGYIILIGSSCARKDQAETDGEKLTGVLQDNHNNNKEAIHSGKIIWGRRRRDGRRMMRGCSWCARSQRKCSENAAAIMITLATKVRDIVEGGVW